MHIALWIVQGLLALAFGMTGFMKLGTPIEELATQMSWVNHLPAFLVRTIGALELAGAVGLILPAATRIKPKLTNLAALGLVATMAGAALTHLLIGEFMILPNIILGALALFVAWGRKTKAPIVPR
jgi:hypothetical protein